jgi:hypothetical protein
MGPASKACLALSTLWTLCSGYTVVTLPISRCMVRPRLRSSAATLGEWGDKAGAERTDCTVFVFVFLFFAFCFFLLELENLMHHLGVGGEDHSDHDDHGDHADHSHPDRKASHQDSELHTPHNSNSSVWDTVRHSCHSGERRQPSMGLFRHLTPVLFSLPPAVPECQRYNGCVWAI